MSKRKPRANKKILILGTSPMNLYHHRLELVKELLNQHIEVHIAAPYGEEVPLLEKVGCHYHSTAVDARGVNPVADIKLLRSLINIIKNINPDIVLTFYTKTNIYGGLACRFTKTPYIENITGLGTALGNGGIKEKIMAALYKAAIKKAHLVYFQNQHNFQFFKNHKMPVKLSEMIPGSGVALNRHKILPYPDSSEKIRFAFLGRVLAQKGFYEFADAAERISKKYPQTEFHIIGPATGGPQKRIDELITNSNFINHGKVIDIRPLMRQIHCMVFPSYYPEGMANVLLESAAMGRPIITTDCPGCGETVDDGASGYIVKPRDVDSLVEAMEKFILLTDKEKFEMGLAGRKKMESEFDREIVIKSYMRNINTVIGEKR